MFKMWKRPDLLLLLCLLGATDALYKQWIPDNNYENKTNWDKGDVPCGCDRVQFAAQRKVSVFVETTHAVQEMRLPIDGEFILNSGAGFYIECSGQDPGCGAGVTTQFKDPGSLRWFDPTLWQVASTLNDLEHGNFLFSVHEETVPCQYDDVVFKELSSFRVDTSSSQTAIPVKSVSVLGKIFEMRSAFSKYLSSRSGRLQFHGSSAVTVGNPSCGDPSGCECGNSVNHQLICSSISCGSLSCKKPLLPMGHCCGVCGAILTIQYAAGFNLRNYRERVNHLFLIQPQYKSIQVGMSKVSRSLRLAGFIPFGTSPEIQVVILDGAKGMQSEALAREIMKDAGAHGSSLGIMKVEFQASSGNSSDQPDGSAGMVVGVMFGVLILLGLIVIMAILVRKRVFRMPSMPSLIIFRTRSDVGELGGPLDHGYDNPMFDKPTMMPEIPGLYANEANNSISMTQAGVYFVNPVYESETDFNA